MILVRPAAPKSFDLALLKATWSKFDKQRRSAQREIPTDRIVRRQSEARS